MGFDLSWETDGVKMTQTFRSYRAADAWAAANLQGIKYTLTLDDGCC